ncbi:HAD family hydrolase [Deinococcus fonticola]|uniref:HAD family hydrolase n=1 Tax=Deinococcus fonticola TaxID=2528713 RepID=UPI00197AB910|nr:HAD-IA family hydrolase [Deinococcus fonticola]
MLIFDLDGTISDPLPGIAQAINHALSEFGFPTLPEQDVAPFVGPPLDGTFLQLTGAGHPEVLELIATYRECYRDSCLQNTVYGGVPETLAALSSAGVRMGICTSKRADFAERILSHLGLRPHFEFVSGGDIGIHKWQQLEALQAAGTLQPHAMMIGDRAVDIEAGRRNGLRTGGVLWGFGSRAELEEAAPDVMFTQPDEWLEIKPS